VTDFIKTLTLGAASLVIPGTEPAPVATVSIIPVHLADPAGNRVLGPEDVEFVVLDPDGTLVNTATTFGDDEIHDITVASVVALGQTYSLRKPVVLSPGDHTNLSVDLR